MLTLWNDFDRAFFRTPWTTPRLRSARPLTRLLEEKRSTNGRLRANLVDKGDELVFKTDIPGLAEEELEVTINKDVLTLRAERSFEPIEGARTLRQERGAWTLHRSYTLPTGVDPENSNATLKDGVLTVRMAKAPEYKPRQITVNGG